MTHGRVMQLSHGQAAKSAISQNTILGICPGLQANYPCLTWHTVHTGRAEYRSMALDRALRLWTACNAGQVS